MTSKKTLQRRIFSEPFQIRTNSDGTIGVRGYAAVFDSEAHGEVIRSSAFNRTIAQRDDIRLLVNHDGVPLARTKSGTLEVGVDDHGLWFDAPSLDPANPRVQELTSAMARQDIDQCSFAGYFTDVKRGQGGVDEVCEVKAIDVSIVTYPWYDETSAELTGDRDTDRALVSMRSLTADQTEAALEALDPTQQARIVRALRAAPPGKSSYSDEKHALTEALEESLGCWVYVYDWGSDWVVFIKWDDREYEWSDYWQTSWELNGTTYTFGTPFAVEAVTEYRPADDGGDGSGDRSAPQADPPAPVTYKLSEARALLRL